MKLNFVRVGSYYQWGLMRRAASPFWFVFVWDWTSFGLRITYGRQSWYEPRGLEAQIGFAVVGLVWGEREGTAEEDEQIAAAMRCERL